MMDADAWLSQHTGYCRLGAWIQEAVCADQRRRNEDSRCSGCNGLDRSVTREEIMSSRCNERGCSKVQVFRGFCTGHVHSNGLTEEFMRVKAQRKAKSVRPDVDEVATADVAPAPHDYAIGESVDGYVIDALREAWRVKQSEIIAGLSGMPKGRCLIMAGRWIESIDSLEV